MKTWSSEWTRLVKKLQKLFDNVSKIRTEKKEKKKGKEKKFVWEMHF